MAGSERTKAAGEVHGLLQQRFEKMYWDAVRNLLRCPPSYARLHECQKKRQEANLGFCSPSSLALAEIYVVVGTLFRRFDFELYGTTREDIEAEHDLFIPRPKNMATLGVRVKAKC
jgi:hypothetical protein